MQKKNFDYYQFFCNLLEASPGQGPPDSEPWNHSAGPGAGPPDTEPW
ncbi:MAG: hypothetical protein ACTSUO_07535 [Candidatus Thorarchaeota archaeon]